jgi:hypothetical protein
VHSTGSPELNCSNFLHVWRMYGTVRSGTISISSKPSVHNIKYLISNNQHSTRRPVFDSGTVYVDFVMGELANKREFSHSILVAPFRIILQFSIITFRLPSTLYRLNIAIDSVVPKTLKKYTCHRWLPAWSIYPNVKSLEQNGVHGKKFYPDIPRSLWEHCKGSS